MIGQFVTLSKSCDSVICCRVTPKQKAEVVRLIKNNLKKITLAIGDGANDVNMIQEAHIGIGIYGKEGMRAVQSSDFAIGEFQCLWRLLLIHGRWCYKRTSLMIIYFFYKNMIFTIPHFFFSFVCGSSAQTIFDDWYISFYNLFFTALPLIVRAVFEQDIDSKLRKQDKTEKVISSKKSPEISIKNEKNEKNIKNNDKTIKSDRSKTKDDKKMNKIKNFKKTHPPFQILEDQYLKNNIPRLYYIGQEKTLFTTNRFMGWVMWAIFQSIILFGLNFLVFEDVVLNKEGYTGDLWTFSITYFTTIILLVDLKLAINTTYWICLNWIALIPLSFCLYFAYFFVSNYLSSTWAYMTPINLITVMHFYGSVLLGLFCFFLIDYIMYFIPNLMFGDPLTNQLKKYAKKQRKNYQKIKTFTVSYDNPMIQSMRNEDIDEKVSGTEIELYLQNHFSIERPATITQLNVIKL